VQLYPQITLAERKRFNYNQWLKDFLRAFHKNDDNKKNIIEGFLDIAAGYLRENNDHWIDTLLETAATYIPESWWENLRKGIKILANTKPVQWLLSFLGFSPNELTKDNNALKNALKAGVNKVLHWFEERTFAYFDISKTDVNRYSSLAGKIATLGAGIGEFIKKFQVIFNVLQILGIIVNELVTHISPTFEKHKIHRISQTLEHKTFQMRIFHAWPSDPVRYFILDDLMQEYGAQDPYSVIGDPSQVVVIPPDAAGRKKAEEQIEARFNVEHSTLYQAAAADPYQEIPLAHLAPLIRRFVELTENPTDMALEEAKHRLVPGTSKYINCDSKRSTGAGLRCFGIFKFVGDATQTTALEFADYLNKSFAI
jgi:hypothetical protein